MAKSTPRGGRPQPARAAAKSKKTAVVVEADPAADAPGMGVDAGLAVFTTIVLIAALCLVDKIHGTLNGSAILFN